MQRQLAMTTVHDLGNLLKFTSTSSFISRVPVCGHTFWRNPGWYFRQLRSGITTSSISSVQPEICYQNFILVGVVSLLHADWLGTCRIVSSAKANIVKLFVVLSLSVQGLLYNWNVFLHICTGLHCQHVFFYFLAHTEMFHKKFVTTSVISVPGFIYVPSHCGSSVFSLRKVNADLYFFCMLLSWIMRKKGLNKSFMSFDDYQNFSVLF